MTGITLAVNHATCLWTCVPEEGKDCKEVGEIVEWSNFNDGTPVCDCGDDLVLVGFKVDAEAVKKALKELESQSR